MSFEHDMATHSEAEQKLHGGHGGKLHKGHDPKLIAGLKKLSAGHLSKLHHAITHVLKERAESAEGDQPPGKMNEATFQKWSKKMMQGGSDE
jgi:hypothetical protein